MRKLWIVAVWVTIAAPGAAQSGPKDMQCFEDGWCQMTVPSSHPGKTDVTVLHVDADRATTLMLTCFHAEGATLKDDTAWSFELSEIKRNVSDGPLTFRIVHADRQTVYDLPMRKMSDELKAGSAASTAALMRALLLEMTADGDAYVEDNGQVRSTFKLYAFLTRFTDAGQICSGAE